MTQSKKAKVNLESIAQEFDEKWKQMREGGFGKHASLDGRMIWEVDDDEDAWLFADETIKSFWLSRFRTMLEEMKKEIEDLEADLSFGSLYEHKNGYNLALSDALSILNKYSE